jgi:hypothetical protein
VWSSGSISLSQASRLLFDQKTKGHAVARAAGMALL